LVYQITVIDDTEISAFLGDISAISAIWDNVSRIKQELKPESMR